MWYQACLHVVLKQPLNGIAQCSKIHIKVKKKIREITFHQNESANDKCAHEAGDAAIRCTPPVPTASRATNQGVQRKVRLKYFSTGRLRLSSFFKDLCFCCAVFSLAIVSVLCVIQFPKNVLEICICANRLTIDKNTKGFCLFNIYIASMFVWQGQKIRC